MPRPKCPLFILQAALATTLFAQTPAPTPAPAPDEPPPPADVRDGNQTLFTIRTGVGNLTPAARGNLLSRRLNRLRADSSFQVSSISLENREVTTDILASDTVLFTVTDGDAAAGIGRLILAGAWAAQIRTGITRVRGEYSPAQLFIDAGYATLTTLVLILILVLRRRLYEQIQAAIQRTGQSRIKAVRIQSFSLLSAQRITDILQQIVRIGRFGVTLLMLYFYLPLVFSFFPQTQEWSAILLGYVISPLRAGISGFINYIPSLIVLTMVVFLTYGILRVAKAVFRAVERGSITWRNFYPEWAMTTYKLFEVLVLAFALVVMFPYLPGSESSAFRAVSIFLGVLLSLGSSSAVTIW